jgi:hypothetical protein
MGVEEEATRRATEWRRAEWSVMLVAESSENLPPAIYFWMPGLRNTLANQPFHVVTTTLNV